MQHELLDIEQHYIIDVRSTEEYTSGHLEESYSFPWNEINDDACGLPERNASLTVIVPADTQDSNEQTQICAESDLQEQDNSVNIKRFFVKLGYRSVEVCTINELHAPIITTVLRHTDHCWSPNAFLAEHIATIEQHCSAKVALDVGAGTGRDMVLLALRRWAVWGVDNRTKLLTQGRRLARKHHVDECVHHLLCDLRHGLPFAAGTFDLIHVCRFIHRPSLPAVLQLLRPGGWLLYVHFLDGCQFTQVGRPKNRNGFFEIGELEEMIADNGLCLVSSSRALLGDGRPVVCALARRPTLGEATGRNEQAATTPRTKTKAVEGREE